MFYLQVLINAMSNLKRKCPKCKRNQIVSAKNNRKPVKCKFCGAEVPPRKTS